MKHDPEKNAAYYLTGGMSRRRRKAFEEHILHCEDCWSEVEHGRRGRSLAEAARELTPHGLRERVRMSVDATPLPSRMWRRVAAGASIIVVVLVAVTVAVERPVEQQGQPREIALLVADFKRDASIGRVAAKELPRRLGDLRLQESKAGRVVGMDVTAHVYEDSAGHKVVIYRADDTFPVAESAEHSVGGDTWTAEVEGALLFCADHPVPSLVVGDDEREVALAATELGLR